MTDTMTSLFRSQHYDRAHIETSAARASRDFASVHLDICMMQERNAELGSQSFESVARGELKKALGEITYREREIGLAFARYAIYGRTEK